MTPHRSIPGVFIRTIVLAALAVSALPANAETPLRGASSLGVGSYHTCVVTAVGGVQCSGWNTFGQLGNGLAWSDEPSARLVDVVGLGSTAVAVAGGGGHTCAVLGNGSVRCWGKNEYVVLGRPYPETYLSAVPLEVAGITNAVAITAGEMHTCVLTATGGVKCWGNNNFGQTGHGGSEASVITPVDVFGLTSGVVAISAGQRHTCAITSTGAAKCWGSNDYGAIGNGAHQSAFTPADVVGLSSGVIAIAGGSVHSCAVTSGGGVKCWGDNSGGQLGNGTTTPSPTPIDVTGLGAGATAVAAGSTESCAIAGDGSVKCWGRPGGLFYGTNTRLAPADVLSASAGATSIRGGPFHMCAIVAAGEVRCWGSNSFGQLGNGIHAYSTTPVAVVQSATAVGIANGVDHACALMSSGNVACWGRNLYGGLGDGTTTDSFVPVEIANFTGSLVVRAGGQTSCAIDGIGALRCWGYVPGSGEHSTPTVVGGLASGVRDVSLGVSHICVLTTAGAVKCWGFNGYGQLGDGSTTDASTPATVPGLETGVVAIGAGRFHTCAVMSDGSVKCWGDNQSGQVTSIRGGIVTSPFTVTALTEGALSVDGGDNHTCVQTVSFGMQCWGSNFYGELGQGHAWEIPGVHPIALSTGTLGIAVGANHSCQIGGGGTVRCWGSNLRGQVGDGRTRTQPRPTQVPGISGVSMLAATGYSTCALIDTGGVHCWGDNSYGALGNGVGGYALTPQTVVLAHCGEFGDVVAGDPFCANVAWIRNRGVTLGCEPGTFCGSLAVTRLALSAFFNRLGEALTPRLVKSEQVASVSTANPAIVCETQAFAAGDHARRALLDAVLSATTPAPAQFVVSLVARSPFSGWSTLGDVTEVSTVGARWSNVRSIWQFDLPEGSETIFAIMISSPPPGTTVDATCRLRARIDNRN